MITTFTGPMHSSKSETMIKYYNKIYNKDSILVFKPKVDTRDEGIIRRRDLHQRAGGDREICQRGYYEYLYR